ncbi:MAG: ATP synthase F0 subunit B [Bdellovibrionales bacterium]
METINGLILSLGINPTLWTQLAIFLFTFAILNWIVFKPYYNAYEEREKRTVGSKGETDQLVADTAQLQGQYEIEARKVNDQIKLVFDQARQTAQAQQNQILSQAREQSADTLKSARQSLEKEISTAKQMLKSEVTEIGSAITEKLIGKEAMK